MDHLIGQRFSLISKSEIRYVGILHAINPEESTIALEEVRSFGTEERNVENFIPPSQQTYGYIVFRGSDVKDIKIAEEEAENKPPSPPLPPNDPAILNSTRPGPPQGPPPHERRESPYPPPGWPAQGQFNGYYPPPPFGRGYGPPPPHLGYGPGPGYGPPFHPPPGYFGPSGPGFPQGPNQFPHQQAPPPIGPPGQQQQSPDSALPSTAPVQATKQTQELPVEKSAAKDGSQTPVPIPTQAPSVTAIPPPKTSTPPVQKSFAQTAAAAASVPPKASRVTPAMPLQVNQKSFTPPVQPTAPSVSTTNGAAKPVTAQTSMEEASRQAKEAVAAAMAKLNAPSSKPAVPDNSVDSITKKVNELSTGAPPSRGRGGYRGGRGARSLSGGQSRKVEIPKSDFDFESANAKFNKEDLIKEAIASGSPLGEHPDTSLDGESITDGPDGPTRKDSASQVSAYNKSSSFFDNLSSEAKDREESTFDHRQHGRALRGQEFKKNIETFGQGNVDSGYRGRGRGGHGGRGYRGGGYNQNNNRGNRGSGYRGRGRGGAQNPQQAEAQPSTT